MRENLSIGKAVVILRLVAEDPRGLSVSELARRSGLSRITISRLAATLATERLLFRYSDDRYGLGPELARLGALVRYDDILSRIARAPMERVLSACNEAVTLTVLRGSASMETVLQLDPTRIVTTNWVRRTVPLHASSAGKLVLAYAPDEVRIEELAKPLQRFTSHTITDPTALNEDLRQARARGWAESRDEFEIGLLGVSVPVLESTPSERLAAIVSVTGPTARMDAVSQDLLLRELIAAAGQTKAALLAEEAS